MGATKSSVFSMCKSWGQIGSSDTRVGAAEGEVLPPYLGNPCFQSPGGAYCSYRGMWIFRLSRSRGSVSLRISSSGIGGS